jgi:hypothetical protein
MRYPQFQNEFVPFGGLNASAAEATRTFMQRVYWWMVVGLGLTGAVAWGVASTPGVFEVLRPFFYPLMFAQLIVVFAFSFLQARVSGPVAAALFLLYSGLTGVTLSAIFLMFKLGSIAAAFGVTAGAFGALSLYATVTKRDLSAWGTFLFIGLVGIVIAGVVNLFVHSSGLSFVMSCAAVLVFGGLTAYDTQKLRRFHAQHGFRSNMSFAISGALTLYLDFINLFLNLLWLMGGRRDR